jgi:intracellular septation protein A
MRHDQGVILWTYKRPFALDGRPALLLMTMATRGCFSTLSLDGMDLSHDFTPYAGREAIRNHRHSVILPDGRTLHVEAGYYNWVNVAIAVHLDSVLIHESHTGKVIGMPEKVIRAVENAEHRNAVVKPEPNVDFERLKANRIPIIVDLATGLMFFIVAKQTNLMTAAIAGAITGVVLLIVQKATKIDLLGGMAKFGIVMLLISAGLAYVFQDDDMVKMRSTIVGLIGAVAFIADGFAGGRWLGEPLTRYMVYTDILPVRLAFGMGGVGLAMAGLNWFVARTASTDVWLFYTTFLDIAVSMAMILIVIRWARGLPVTPWR